MTFNPKVLRKYSFLIVLLLLTPVLTSLLTSFFKINLVEAFECWCRQDGGQTSSAPATLLPPYTELVGAPVTLTTVKQISRPLPTVGSPLAYTLSFWIKIPDAAPAWRNILRFGPDDSKRNPAVFIWPNNLNLHCRHGTSTDGNAGIDAIPGVVANVWTHFAVTLSGRVMTPYINGVAGAPFTAPADFQPASDQVYIPGDPASYVDPAHLISVGYVWVFPKALAASDIANVYMAAHSGAQ